jgi:hypothetical protein
MSVDPELILADCSLLDSVMVGVTCSCFVAMGRDSSVKRKKFDDIVQTQLAHLGRLPWTRHCIVNLLGLTTTIFKFSSQQPSLREGTWAYLKSPNFSSVIAIICGISLLQL